MYHYTWCVFLITALAHVDESLSTLRFASRAKNIANKPCINEIVSDGTKLKRYKEEIFLLRKQLEAIETKESDQLSNKNTDLHEIDYISLENANLKKKLESMALMVLNSTTTAPIPKKSRKIRRQTWFPGVLANFDDEDEEPQHLRPLSRNNIPEFYKPNIELAASSGDVTKPFLEDIEMICSGVSLTAVPPELQNLVQYIESLKEEVLNSNIVERNAKRSLEQMSSHSTEIQEFLHVEKQLKVNELETIKEENMKHVAEADMLKSTTAQVKAESEAKDAEILELKDTIHRHDADIQTLIQQHNANTEPQVETLKCELASKIQELKDMSNSLQNLVVLQEDSKHMLEAQTEIETLLLKCQLENDALKKTLEAKLKEADEVLQRHTEEKANLLELQSQQHTLFTDEIIVLKSDNSNLIEVSNTALSKLEKSEIDIEQLVVENNRLNDAMGSLKAELAESNAADLVLINTLLQSESNNLKESKLLARQIDELQSALDGTLREKNDSESKREATIKEIQERMNTLEADKLMLKQELQILQESLVTALEKHSELQAKLDNVDKKEDSDMAQQKMALEAKIVNLESAKSQADTELAIAHNSLENASSSQQRLKEKVDTLVQQNTSREAELEEYFQHTDKLESQLEELKLEFFVV
jgi:hypothetical protein